MNGGLADPELTALILWLLLPAALLVGGLCLALWYGRRDWVVVHAVVRTRPEPGDAASPSEIAWRDEAGEVHLAHLRLTGPKGHPPVGSLIVLSHPPGQPKALQPGTPGPLLAGAVAAGLLVLLCIAMVLGV